jgi:hypothetical protein
MRLARFSIIHSHVDVDVKFSWEKLPKIGKETCLQLLCDLEKIKKKPGNRGKADWVANKKTLSPQR